MGEYVSIISGEAPSKFEEGTELYVKVDDLNYNDKYVVDTQNKVAEHSTVKRVTKGSVVFPKRGAAIMTNKVRIIGIDSYMDTNMMALTSEKLDSEFLYNIISKEGLYKIADTSTIPQINNKHVEPYEVTIPSLDEQRRIGAYFKQLDHLITLHQRKLFLNFVKKNDWEQRKFGELYEKVNEKNNLSFGVDKIISVANMYFKEDVKESNDGYMRTYNVMRLGDIAFEGNKSKNFSHGRFVENTIGDGIVSHVFDVFRPVMNYDLLFWKYLINNENVMGRIMTRCTKASTMMTNLVAKDFLNEDILVPIIEEQTKIGECIDKIDHLITLHRRAYYNKKGGLTNVHNDNQQHYAIL